MSNDIYDDLTDEEKALLKREMKHRIEQQRQRENPLPKIAALFLGMGSAGILNMLIMMYQPSRLANNPDRLTIFFGVAGFISFVIGIAILLWHRRTLADKKKR